MRRLLCYNWCNRVMGRPKMPKPNDNLRDHLMQVAAHGTPVLAAFAGWVLDHYAEVAFQSIRGLAQKANVNANTVTRLAKELGFDGYDAFRAHIQRAVQDRATTYGERAQALRHRQGHEIFAETIEAHRHNTEAVFTPALLETLNDCIDPLLSARRVYAVGVRSCYCIAHYFTYTGSMGFPNFVDVPSMPGSIQDQMSMTGPEDIIVAISYDHYATEVVRACQIARECGAWVIALTDSHRSPIAIGAWKVLHLPMAGPQLLPSLTSALVVVELLLAGMAARAEGAAERIEAHEQRVSRFGGFLRD